MVIVDSADWKPKNAILSPKFQSLRGGNLCKIVLEALHYSIYSVSRETDQENSLQ